MEFDAGSILRIAQTRSVTVMVEAFVQIRNGEPERTFDQFEQVLRDGHSPVYLIAAPKTALRLGQIAYDLWHKEAVDFYLYISVNGYKEAAATLRKLRLSASVNMERLKVTGLATEFAKPDPFSSLSNWN